MQLPTKDRSETPASSSFSHCCLWMGSCTKILPKQPRWIEKVFKYLLYLVSECQLNLFKPMELAVQTPVCSWIKKALTSQKQRGACLLLKQWDDQRIFSAETFQLQPYASASAGNQLHPDNSFCPEKNVPVHVFKFTFWPTSFVSMFTLHSWPTSKKKR